MTDKDTQWSVQYTALAREDLKAIVSYIVDELGEREIAAFMYEKLTKGIRSLQSLPYRYPVYHEEPWTSKGLRVMKIRKYLVFYYPEEEELSVSIIRIIYGGRDISRQLSETEQYI